VTSYGQASLIDLCEVKLRGAYPGKQAISTVVSFKRFCSIFKNLIYA